MPKNSATPAASQGTGKKLITFIKNLTLTVSELVKNLIESIQDNQEAQIKLYTQGDEIFELDCIFQKANDLKFLLEFPASTLPEDIDFEEKHPVSIVYESFPVLIVAKITQKINENILKMVAQDTIDPASFREYFRVDISTTIKASSTHPKKTSLSNNWSMTGKTQDLSATGVLALFPKEIQSKNKLLLEITLPDSGRVVTTIAHVIRTRRLRKLRWQAAFHFDRIEAEDREMIIQCCFKEQRRQLRERIQVT